MCPHAAICVLILLYRSILAMQPSPQAHYALAGALRGARNLTGAISEMTVCVCVCVCVCLSVYVCMCVCTQETGGLPKDSSSYCYTAHYTSPHTATLRTTHFLILLHCALHISSYCYAAHYTAPHTASLDMCPHTTKLLYILCACRRDCRNDCGAGGR